MLLWGGPWEKLSQANSGFDYREKKFWYKKHAKNIPKQGPLHINLKRQIRIGKVWCEGRLIVWVDEKKNRVLLINEVPLEEYVESVLTGEVYAGWPIESIKAMAIAIRTYGVYKIKNPLVKEYDVRADERSQVYRPRKNKPEIFTQVAKQTKSQILLYKGQPVLALYSASCGGISEVFGNGEIQYLVGQKQSYCKKTPVYQWTYEINTKTLAKQLGYPESKTQRIVILKRSKGKRVQQIQIQFVKPTQQLNLTGIKFRELLGNHLIKSLQFTYKYSYKNKSWIFIGRGYGHGYGLCQWGSKVLAEKGTSHKKILQRFYPGTTIQTTKKIKKREKLSV